MNEANYGCWFDELPRLQQDRQRYLVLRKRSCRNYITGSTCDVSHHGTARSRKLQPNHL